jgi:hypothetical protein
MLYDDAIKILNRHIFEGEKRNLIKKLASNPERYIGVFRPTKPRGKLVQNLFQSHEIRFGDALEYLLRELIAELGFSNLDRSLPMDDRNTLYIDQYFMEGKQYYFVEQKIRDDHDSTKKHGQIKNFEAKLNLLNKRHLNNLIGIMYFIDPSLSKNKKFYLEELNRLKEVYQNELFLFYGQEFFEFINHPKLWTEIIEWIKQWKTSLPDFPDIDFDLSPSESFEEIKTLRPLYWRKMISNEGIWKDGIIRVLFSKGTTLKLLFGYFSQQQISEYNDLAKPLLERINTYYYKL